MPRHVQRAVRNCLDRGRPGSLAAWGIRIGCPAYRIRCQTWGVSHRERRPRRLSLLKRTTDAQIDLSSFHAAQQAVVHLASGLRGHGKEPHLTNGTKRGPQERISPAVQHVRQREVAHPGLGTRYVAFPLPDVRHTLHAYGTRSTHLEQGVDLLLRGGPL